MATFVWYTKILVLFSDTMKLYFHYFMKFTDVCSLMSVFCIILKNWNTLQYLTTFIYLSVFHELFCSPIS